MSIKDYQYQLPNVELEAQFNSSITKKQINGDEYKVLYEPCFVPTWGKQVKSEQTWKSIIPYIETGRYYKSKLSKDGQLYTSKRIVCQAWSGIPYDEKGAPYTLPPNSNGKVLTAATETICGNNKCCNPNHRRWQSGMGYIAIPFGKETWKRHSIEDFWKQTKWNQKDIDEKMDEWKKIVDRDNQKYINQIQSSSNVLDKQAKIKINHLWTKLQIERRAVDNRIKSLENFIVQLGFELP